MAAVVAPAAAPVLSTPDQHILEDQPPSTVTNPTTPRLSRSEIYIVYEIERTISKLQSGKWKRIALQFPDGMLVDAPSVYDLLSQSLDSTQQVGAPCP